MTSSPSTNYTRRFSRSTTPVTNPEGIQEIRVSPLGPEFDSFTIGLPFLNPRRKYEDYLGVTLYAPKPLAVKAVTGKGFGWGTKYIDKAEYIDRVARVIIEGTSPLAIWLLKLKMFL
jgi:hypothetical protein